MLVKTFDLISKCGDTFKHYGYVDQRKESGVHIKYINVIKGMYKGANQQSVRSVVVVGDIQDDLITVNLHQG